MSEHKKLKYTRQLMVLLWLLMLLLVNTGLCNVARSYKGFDSCSMYAYGSTVLYKHYMYEASGCRHQVLHVSQQLVRPCLVGFSNYRALET